jgi:hypothetical protein
MGHLLSDKLGRLFKESATAKFIVLSLNLLWWTDKNHADPPSRKLLLWSKTKLECQYDDRKFRYRPILKKSEVSLMHAIKADSGCAGTAPFIPNKGPRWRWVASLAWHAYRSTPGKRFHLYPLNRRLGWPQSQYARFCEQEKNLFAPAGIRIPDHPARSLRSPGTASCGHKSNKIMLRDNAWKLVCTECVTVLREHFEIVHTVQLSIMYKVVQIWPGQTVTCLHTNSPGHIWTTLYLYYPTRCMSIWHIVMVSVLQHVSVL